MLCALLGLVSWSAGCCSLAGGRAAAAAKGLLRCKTGSLGPLSVRPAQGCKATTGGKREAAVLKLYTGGCAAGGVGPAALLGTAVRYVRLLVALGLARLLGRLFVGPLSVGRPCRTVAGTAGCISLYSLMTAARASSSLTKDSWEAPCEQALKALTQQALTQQAQGVTRVPSAGAPIYWLLCARCMHV